jgi:hypothetical protein
MSVTSRRSCGPKCSQKARHRVHANAKNDTIRLNLHSFTTSGGCYAHAELVFVVASRIPVGSRPTGQMTQRAHTRRERLASSAGQPS